MGKVAATMLDTRLTERPHPPPPADLWESLSNLRQSKHTGYLVHARQARRKRKRCWRKRGLEGDPAALTSEVLEAELV